MQDVILVNDQWYVLASSSRADARTRVLKHGETFAIFDRFGDFQPIGVGEQGLYHQGTRFLSRAELLVNDRRPMLLNSAVAKDNSLFTVDLTTPDLYQDGKLTVPKGTVHLFRSMILQEGVWYEHLRLTNFGGTPVNLAITRHFEADFADIFEVRGVRRRARGELLAPEAAPSRLLLSYQGLDGRLRRTVILYDPAPEACQEDSCVFSVTLEPGSVRDLYLTVVCVVEDLWPRTTKYGNALAENQRSLAASREKMAQVFTANEQFNDWLTRSYADLLMLLTTTNGQRYPYAGVPWFSTPFGRDGIITALSTLWIDPSIGRSVLSFLAEHQAREEDPEADAEPGKILHEMRLGEMAELGEIPFRKYYGSVDATPLFVVLAGHYYRRTGDLAFIRSIWPAVRKAVEWIDTYGDKDGDGFVEYAKQSVHGIVQQGWKDSNDSVFHADGSDASPPIALCEVQAYVYAARMEAATLARLLDDVSMAEEQERKARELKQRFNQAFWDDELSTFVLALDEKKRPCRVISSNAGQVLFSGIAEPDHAKRVAETLLAPASFSGWGIRTLPEGTARYNPMSYHNGSVWPHDNALIAWGFARYGLTDAALQVLCGLFNASIFVELNRLPELFCGFPKRPDQGPTLYPVACAPQAWASSAPFLLLASVLGMECSPTPPQVRFRHPVLPDYLDFVRITNLAVAGGVLDLELRRHRHDVGVNLLRKEGEVEVAVLI